VVSPWRPLAREISAGCAPKGARPPAAKAASEGDLDAVCGVRLILRLCSYFVSIAEVDKRRAVLAITGE